MSKEPNTQLMERAAEVCKYFESTIVEDAILNAIDANNLGLVMRLVQEAEFEMEHQEINPPLTDEQMDQMVKDTFPEIYKEATDVY